MESRLWGTALVLRLAGAPAGGRCRLVAVARDGRTEVAASWAGVAPARTMTVDGATSIPRSELARLEVVTGDAALVQLVPTP